MYARDGNDLPVSSNISFANTKIFPYTDCYCLV